MTGDDRRLAAVEDVPAESTLLVTLREGSDEREALLVRLDDGVACWRNYCQHWTDVRLDRGSGARVKGGEIWCQKHAATFDPTTGECTFGPCEGAYLEEVDVEVRDGGVYLADDDYAFVRQGPAEENTDESLTSGGGRIDFTGS
ncbi:Rieske (2Fe-2S) protein [Halorarius halobius]|uniref:Rieske (2Fe-2S) protein n=1 Tax=Halorarius halobius TaxID=2962671 RepID=UPI0020CB7A91|nr:Rieske 2Fe-2S domain-containing protein [Halorarius halobius]